LSVTKNWLCAQCNRGPGEDVAALAGLCMLWCVTDLRRARASICDLEVTRSRCVDALRPLVGLTEYRSKMPVLPRSNPLGAVRPFLIILFFSLLFLGAFAGPGVAGQANSVALLIGNTEYPDAVAAGDPPLKEPISDARALGSELRGLGFDVDVGENLTKEATARAFDRLYGKIKSGSTALIFFSGFGIQSDRQSYILPVNARIWNEADVRHDGFSLEKIIDEMHNRGAKVKIAIIDASRKNPYERRFRSVAAGLAAVQTPAGTLLMSSASPGALVNDASPPVFMGELLKELKVPGTKLEEAFYRTSTDVRRATKSQQVPSIFSTLEEDLALAPSPTGPSSPESRKEPPEPNPKPAPPVAKPPEPISRPPQEGATPPAKPPAGSKDKETPTARPKTTPEDPYQLGVSHAKDGEYQLAIKDFDEAIRLDPQHAEALNNRCWVRAVIGQLQDAMNDCNEALRLGNRYALDSRGLVELKLGLFKNAISDYDAALVLDSKQASSLYGRGIAKLRSGNDSGNGDISAAKLIKPTIADEFAGYGIK
jgi:Caspase domain/Tetratricopeptide repeat